MIAIPQCLDFEDIPVKEVCEFYLKMLAMKNQQVYYHSKQVANYASSVAAKLGLPAAEVSRIRTAALMHDIGLMAVPNLILAKRPFLTPREEGIYKRHCVSGASMLENMPGFIYICEIIQAHHERWNGKGFPKRLKGANIPLGARILAVADYYDRNINPCTQHYQKTHAEAVGELQDKAGIDFDPIVVKAFIEAILPKTE